MTPALPSRIRPDPFAMPKTSVRKAWAASAGYDGTHGDAKHKWYCKAKPDPNVAKCPPKMTASEALALVRQGLLMGLVKADVYRQKAWPLRVYAFREGRKGGKDWFEAKRTFIDKGEYHGYPIEEKAVPAPILKRTK
jgi:hypothetical protein